MTAVLSPRDRLLRAARLFYEEGINATGIDRVIETAGVAKMSLYRTFGSKDGLVEAYLRRHDERVRDHFERGVEARAKTGREKVLAMFDVLEEVLRDPGFRGCAFINASVEAPSRTHVTNVVAIAHKDAARAMFARYASEAGVVDAEVLARRLMLLLDGAFADATMRGDPTIAAEAKAVAAILVDDALARSKSVKGPSRSRGGAHPRGRRPA